MNKKPTVFFAHHNNAKANVFMAKLLSGICELVQASTDKEIQDISILQKKYDHIFLELDPKNPILDENLAKLATTTLVISEELPYEKLLADSSITQTFCTYPCIFPLRTPAADLAKVLLTHISPQFSPGIAPLLPEQSKIYINRSESANDIGLVEDVFSENALTDFPELQARNVNLRQITTLISHLAMKNILQNGSSLPMCVSQFGIANKKVTFQIKFPFENFDAQSFQKSIVLAKDHVFYQLWMLSDLLMITYYEASKELEVRTILYENPSYKEIGPRSILINQVGPNIAVANPTTPPANYTFVNLQEIIEPTVKEKFKVFPTKNKMQSNSSTREAAIAKLAAKQKTTNMEKEKGEDEAKSMLQTNALNQQLENVKKETEELREKLKKALQNQANTSSRTDEKYTQLEVKYKEKQKIILERDKKINELSGNLKKLLEENARLKRASSENGEIKNTGGEGQINQSNEKLLKEKIIELEETDKKSKQALKQLAFKAENADKIVAAAKKETDETKKLMEKKLEHAKQRESDLSKKVAELENKIKEMKRKAA